MRGDGRHVGPATDQCQHREGPGREAEGTHTIGIDLAVTAPRSEHVVQCRADLAGALTVEALGAGRALVGEVVARMRRRGHDKACGREVHREVQVAGKTAAIAV